MQVAHFFKSHRRWTLVILAIAFVVVIVGFHVWGIGSLVRAFSRATALPEPGASANGFNLDAARRLKLGPPEEEVAAPPAAPGVQGENAGAENL